MNNYQYKFEIAKWIDGEVTATVKLVERDKNHDCSRWLITTQEDASFLHGGNERVLPAGAQFKYSGGFDDTEEETVEYVMHCGLADACGIARGDFERMLETPKA